MADNVELDAGTGGAVVSTEEVTTLNGGAVSAQHVQRMLLAYRTGDGTAADLTGDTTNGLDVDVTRSALPTGASTSANQTTIIGHLDGVEGLLTTIDGDTDTISTNSATLAGAVSGTEMQVDVVAALPAGDNNIGNVDVATSALPTGAATAANQTTVIGHLDGVEGLLTTIDADTGNIVTSVQLLDDAIVADDAAFTVGTTKVNVAGFIADQSSTDSVNEGDAGAARMTLDRKQIVTSSPSADTEGLDTFRSADIDETEEDVKTSAGKLYGWAVYNDHSAEVFIQFWNATAANTTPGTTAPRVTFPLAAGASANFWVGDGITFDTAISVGATSTFAGGSDPTGPVSGTIFYK